MGTDVSEESAASVLKVTMVHYVSNKCRATEGRSRATSVCY